MTRERLPCSRYRTPPWTSLVLRLEVPFPKSLCSSSRTSYPRLAPSIATPAPVAPPPTTIMSHGAVRERSRRYISDLVMAPMIAGSEDQLQGELDLPRGIGGADGAE